MKTLCRICSTGPVVLALLGFAVSTAEANVYTNRQVIVEGFWDGSAYDSFFSTPTTVPVREGEIGHGNLMEQPVVTFAPLTQVRVLGQYDPIVDRVIPEPGFPKKETFEITLKGKISENEWVAVKAGGGDLLEWRVTTNAPTFLENFDFSYIRTTTTEQYKLDPVPEPTAAAVLGLGLAAFAWLRRRQLPADRAS
jgi:hypothetical protein